MVIKSYSQHKEDLFLFDYINKNNIDCSKNIVDIGALTGTHNSNSRLFLDEGWKGYLIEPNPTSNKKNLVL